MSVLFFGVIGAVALVMRFLGRDPLHRSHDPGAASYWTAPRRQRNHESYFRQF
jgi:hypothetical protein